MKPRLKTFRNRTYSVKPIEQRFWEKVAKRSPEDCWNWTASTDPAGYGKIGKGQTPSKTIRASRVSWIIHFGKIPPGKYVLHNCDNPLCVNPNHLKLGNAQTNMDDRRNRGRMPVGSQVKNAKLTESQVAVIKRTKGKLRFGASSATVSLIISGKQWKHVEI